MKKKVYRMLAAVMAAAMVLAMVLAVPAFACDDTDSGVLAPPIMMDEDGNLVVPDEPLYALGSALAINKWGQVLEDGAVIQDTALAVRMAKLDPDYTFGSAPVIVKYVTIPDTCIPVGFYVGAEGTNASAWVEILRAATTIVVTPAGVIFEATNELGTFVGQVSPAGWLTVTYYDGDVAIQLNTNGLG